jgi:hypothetical protein
MARFGRSANENFEQLMDGVSDYGTRTAENEGVHGHTSGRDGGRRRRESSGGFGAALATLVSIVALAFSGFSFYETVLKEASLRFYSPPLITMFREGYRDVFALPVTISNDGAQRGTILSFDLEVTHRGTGQKMSFQNLYYGTSPKDGEKKVFVPISIAGRSTFTGVVMFHALKTGSFVETTGGVELPLTFRLKMNVDRHSEWGPYFKMKPPGPVTFDMTASYIAGMRDMESGRPTQLHDNRWHAAKEAAKE